MTQDSRTLRQLQEDVARTLETTVGLIFQVKAKQLLNVYRQALIDDQVFSQENWSKSLQIAIDDMQKKIQNEMDPTAQIYWSTCVMIFMQEKSRASVS